MFSRPSVSRRQDLSLAAIIIAAWLAIMATAVSIWLKPWPDILFRADFVSYWTAASMLRDGHASAMFDIETQRAFQENLRASMGTSIGTLSIADLSPFYNPPVMAYLFVPLTVLPMPLAYVLWNVVSLAMLIAAVALPLCGRPWGTSLGALLITFGGVAVTLFEGQANAIFVLALSFAMLLSVSRRPFAAGALLGLIWLKPQYAVVFVLVFIVKRRWRELAGMSAIGLALAALSVGAVGSRGVTGYLTVMSRIGGYYPPAGFRISPQAMANWRGLLMNLAPGISETSGYVLMVVLGVATVLLSLRVWRGSWDPASQRFSIQMLVVVLTTIIVSPHSHFHGTVLLLPPLAMMLREPGGGLLASRRGKAAASIGYALALAAIPMRSLSWLFVPFSLGVIAFVVLISPQPNSLTKADLVGSEAC